MFNYFVLVIRYLWTDSPFENFQTLRKIPLISNRFIGENNVTLCIKTILTERF